MEAPLLARSAASRIAIALFIAPLTPCVLLAVEGPGEWWLLPAFPYAYYFGLIGAPAYLVFRSFQWLRFWQVVAGGVGLGAILALVFMSGFVAGVLRFAAYGAITAVVFWVLACAPLRLSHSNPKG